MRDRTHNTRVEVRVHDGERERERVSAEREGKMMRYILSLKKETTFITKECSVHSESSPAFRILSDNDDTGKLMVEAEARAQVAE